MFVDFFLKYCCACVLACLNVWLLKFCSLEVLKSWIVGVLECWDV